jgi:transcriptional antiterminator RfaH
MKVNIDSPKWYLAQIKANGFDRAVANLARQGFLTFSPMQNKTVRHARQLKNVLRPIFPGYLFVQFGAARSDWRKINSTFGVSRLVSFAKSVPAPVPDTLIAGLQARCNGQNILLPIRDIEIGEKVRLLSGPFADFVGEVEDMVGQDNVRVLLDIMGQYARIDVQQGQLSRF